MPKRRGGQLAWNQLNSLRAIGKSFRGGSRLRGRSFVDPGDFWARAVQGECFMIEMSLMSLPPRRLPGRPFPIAVWIGAIALSALASGCASSRAPARTPTTGIPRETRPESAPRTGQTGEASWYGERHHGRLTASGAPSDRDDLPPAPPRPPR